MRSALVLPLLLVAVVVTAAATFYAVRDDCAEAYADATVVIDGYRDSADTFADISVALTENTIGGSLSALSMVEGAVDGYNDTMELESDLEEYECGE